MKKILFFILGLGLLFAACNPMEDINNEIDAKTITNVSKDIAITLSKANYEAMKGNVAKNYAFSASDPANNYIPAFLKGLHPYLTSGSVAKITYNYNVGSLDLSKYSGAKTYKLTEANYNSVSDAVKTAQYFSPKNPAATYLPAILSSSVTGAQSGDIYIVSYMYSDIEPEVITKKEVTAFEYEFASNLGSFTTYDALGTQNWYWSSYSGTGFAKISGYSGGNKPNEDWLISPEIDLSDLTESTLNANQTAKFVNGQWNQLQILVSDNYSSGNPATATWTTLTPTTLPTGTDYTFVETGTINISAFDGKKIHVAFKYVSSDTNAATWEVNKLTVKGMSSSTKSGIIVTPITVEELYTYTTSWKKTTEAYYVTAADYDAMGAPGQYDNFSSSILPGNYLPQLLGIRYPYAQEGSSMIVIYKYYSSGVKTRADKYFITNGQWNIYNPVIEKTDQYILANSNEWVFDPTVNYTMLAADYQMIVDYVKTNIGAQYISSYGNNETYYGSNAYYSEFQIGTAYFNTKFATWQDAVKEAVGKAYLPSKYPNAVAQVEGIDVNYIITFAAYASSMINYTIEFQCTKSGPSPEFTYVAGPTLK